MLPALPKAAVRNNNRLWPASRATTLREMGSPDGPGCLLADAEFGNDRLVTLGIVFLEVVEQAAPLADQHEKPAA